VLLHLLEAVALGLGDVEVAPDDAHDTGPRRNSQNVRAGPKALTMVVALLPGRGRYQIMRA